MAEVLPIRSGMVAKDGDNSDVVAFLNAAIAEHVGANAALPAGGIIILFDADGRPNFSLTGISVAHIAYAALHLNHIAMNPSWPS